MVSYSPKPGMPITLSLGNLGIETERGDFLQSTDYDVAFFVGLGIDLRSRPLPTSAA